jgi:hypothetical protein
LKPPCHASGNATWGEIARKISKSTEGPEILFVIAPGSSKESVGKIQGWVFRFSTKTRIWKKAPHPTLSPRRGKKRPISQERAAQDQQAKGNRISSPGGEGRVRGFLSAWGNRTPK